MCYLYVFNYGQCFCSRPLLDRIPCKTPEFCTILTTREIPINLACAGCRVFDEEVKKWHREKLLNTGVGAARDSDMGVEF